MKQAARNATQIGAIIRRARRKAGISQTELGIRVGLRQATISRLERGEPAMRLQTLLDVLSALGLEILIDRRGRRSARDLEQLF